MAFAVEYLIIKTLRNIVKISISERQLLISTLDLDFFQKIKDNEIALDIVINDSISKDVLAKKKIDEICPDITKTKNLLNEMTLCLSKKFKVKN
jgi:hypothetical protein